MNNIIETPNLRLIACDTAILKAAIQGNKALGEILNVAVPDNWTVFGKDVFRYVLEKLSDDTSEQYWWTYLLVHKMDNTLIGSGGYKGKPTAEGVIEIGYEIAEDYRNQGYATEMARALISNAFSDNQVKIILAHTMAEENASAKVLRKCGFTWVEEIFDSHDGNIWKWDLSRSNYSHGMLNSAE